MSGEAIAGNACCFFALGITVEQHELCGWRWRLVLADYI
jgi:hypothetical protein